MLYAVMIVLAVSGQYDVVDRHGPYTDPVKCQERLMELMPKIFEKVGLFEVKKMGCKTKRDWIDELGRNPFRRGEI